MPTVMILYSKYIKYHTVVELCHFEELIQNRIYLKNINNKLILKACKFNFKFLFYQQSIIYKKKNVIKLKCLKLNNSYEHTKSAITNMKNYTAKG